MRPLLLLLCIVSIPLTADAALSLTLWVTQTAYVCTPTCLHADTLTDAAHRLGTFPDLATCQRHGARLLATMQQAYADVERTAQTQTPQYYRTLRVTAECRDSHGQRWVITHPAAKE